MFFIGEGSHEVNSRWKRQISFIHKKRAEDDGKLATIEMRNSVIKYITDGIF